MKRIGSSAAVLIAVLFLLAGGVQAQTGGLKGTVRANSGASISGATVSVRQDGKEVGNARSDAKGKFVIDGLRSGIYNVLFDARGYGSGVLYGVEVKAATTRDLGDRLILFPDQGTQVIIKGSVFYHEGTSIAGAKVEIERINADGTTRKIGTALSTISGEFTFRQPEGDAKFRVTAKFRGKSGSKDVVVTNVGIYRLAITLDLSRSER